MPTIVEHLHQQTYGRDILLARRELVVDGIGGNDGDVQSVFLATILSKLLSLAKVGGSHDDDHIGHGQGVEVLIADGAFVDNALEAGGVHIDQGIFANAGFVGRETVAARYELAFHVAWMGYIPKLDVAVDCIAEFITHEIAIGILCAKQLEIVGLEEVSFALDTNVVESCDRWGRTCRRIVGDGDTKPCSIVNHQILVQSILVGKGIVVGFANDGVRAKQIAVDSYGIGGTFDGIDDEVGGDAQRTGIDTFEVEGLDTVGDERFAVFLTTCLSQIDEIVFVDPMHIILIHCHTRGPKIGCQFLHCYGCFVGLLVEEIVGFGVVGVPALNEAACRVEVPSKGALTIEEDSAVGSIVIGGNLGEIIDYD